MTCTVLFGLLKDLFEKDCEPGETLTETNLNNDICVSTSMVSGLYEACEPRDNPDGSKSEKINFSPGVPFSVVGKSVKSLHGGDGS